MRLHADRTIAVRVDGAELAWVSSPEPGVERRLLERIGDEVARATSIVRYRPGSRFASHRHEMGEEFLVLDGVFSDGTGDYPAGSYVRNPPGSAHAPSSTGGCVIFVKLRQMRPEQNRFLRVPARERIWRAGPETGCERAVLYCDEYETVCLERLAPGASLPARDTPGGEELFVLEGGLQRGHEPGGMLLRWSWSRDPAPRQPALASPQGALLWIKRGHLRGHGADARDR